MQELHRGRLCVKEQALDNREWWGLGPGRANPTFQASVVLSECSCRWGWALGASLQAAGHPRCFGGQSCVLGWSGDPPSRCWEGTTSMRWKGWGVVSAPQLQMDSRPPPFFPGRACGMQKFTSRGSNSSHNSDTRSLTHRATRKLLYHVFLHLPTDEAKSMEKTHYFPTTLVSKGPTLFPLRFHWQELVTWPHLDARDAGKYSP